jgi:hypothetical protein
VKGVKERQPDLGGNQQPGWRDNLVEPDSDNVGGGGRAKLRQKSRK